MADSGRMLVTSRSADACAHIVRIRLRCRDVMFKVFFVREVCSSQGQRHVLRIGVLRLEVEAEVAIDAEV